MKITNVNVWGMEDTLIASGYPMQVDTPSDAEFSEQAKACSFLLKNENFIRDFYTYQKHYDKWDYKQVDGVCDYCGSSNNVSGVSMDGELRHLCSKHAHQYYKYGKVWETTPKYELRDDDVKVTVYGDKGSYNELLISYADLPMFFYKEWAVSDGYCRCADGSLHRLIMGVTDSNLVVDHINKNPLDNRRSNLRICTYQENSRNSSKHKIGDNRFIGVSFDKGRNLWRAYINIDGKQLFLGRFETERDAIVARLQAEATYFKEFSPQIELFNEYGIEFEFVRPDEDSANIKKALVHYKRLCHLSQAPCGSGHNCADKGIVVQFDCNAPRYWWNQLQRYHFIDFVSSCSQMHRIGKLDLETNPDMFPETIEHTKKVVERFNNKEITIDQCLANVPQGIELTARLVTNYLQLKTIYNQRRTHRSRHWQEFCDWVETLPYARDFIIPEKEAKQ